MERIAALAAEVQCETGDSAPTYRFAERQKVCRGPA